MSHLFLYARRSTLSVLIVLCLAALTVSYAYAGNASRPLAATTVLGAPDAAVNGKFAVGSATVGSKALTVTGVIDFLGAGTVHNYFSQGGGNNMQINSNVDEANTVDDATRSQWKLVLGSSLDQFSLRRSPTGGTYNEDALFFIDGDTGNVGIATVDTSNLPAIPFTTLARLHVQTASGDAILGLATATTGVTYGMYGRSDSPSGVGVFGFASATTVSTTGASYGVYGRSDSPSGVGVYGTAVSTTGTNYAGYFSGNVHVNGTLTKSAGGFRIDHPLDPSNMYLSHSFVESPDMTNLYTGVVTLDDNGEAWVELPDWFEALNKDFRYALTPIGQSAPLYIAEEIQDNQFKIGGGVAGMEVSWFVTGIRHDPYAEENRIPVEEDKPAAEPGDVSIP